MSYFDWINPTGYQDLFSAGSQATQKQPAASKQFAFSDYKLPSQPSSTWTDPATGLTMDRVASSRYYDVESEKTKTGYNWQGTRVDIYKTARTLSTPLPRIPTRSCLAMTTRTAPRRTCFPPRRKPTHPRWCMTKTLASTSSQTHW